MTEHEKLIAMADMEEQYVITAGYVPPPKGNVVTAEMLNEILSRIQQLEATVRRLEQERQSSPVAG